MTTPPAEKEAHPPREHFTRKHSIGTRVRHDRGKFEYDAGRNIWRFVPGWLGLSWAATRSGTVVDDLDYSGGADWKAMGCGDWAVPDYATAVLFDGEERPTWVRSSLLTPVGFAQADPVQFELFGR